MKRLIATIILAIIAIAIAGCGSTSQHAGNHNGYSPAIFTRPHSAFSAPYGYYSHPPAGRSR
jgi:uncharacterized lipoprotein